MYVLLVSILKNFHFACRVLMCFVRLSEYTVIISVNIANRLVFVLNTSAAFSDIGTKFSKCYLNELLASKR
jgi:hypothetical protein